jgi:hypothetical protein
MATLHGYAKSVKKGASPSAAASKPSKEIEIQQGDAYKAVVSYGKENQKANAWKHQDAVLAYVKVRHALTRAVLIAAAGVDPAICLAPCLPAPARLRPATSHPPLTPR